MPDNENVLLGEKLKDFFSRQGLTQQAIADRLGVSQSAVSALLNGKPFGKKNATKWGDEFGIQPSWLLTGEGEMLKTDTPKPISLVENREGVISIPSDVWEVIKNQSASLKAKDDQINTLISQSKSEREETVQALKNTISTLEKELAKRGKMRVPIPCCYTGGHRMKLPSFEYEAAGIGSIRKAAANKYNNNLLHLTLLNVNISQLTLNCYVVYFMDNPIFCCR